MISPSLNALNCGNLLRVPTTIPSGDETATRKTFGNWMIRNQASLKEDEGSSTKVSSLSLKDTAKTSRTGQSLSLFGFPLMMKSRVFSWRHNSEVLNPIVSSVPVDMVDNLIIPKIASQYAFHDQPMNTDTSVSASTGVLRVPNKKIPVITGKARMIRIEQLNPIGLCKIGYVIGCNVKRKRQDIVKPYIERIGFLEIKGFGDTVEIRTIPEVSTFEYYKGMDLPYKSEESPKVQLKIDKGRGFCFPVNSVDKKQADIDYVSAWSKDAAFRLKIAVDARILSDVYADVDSSNAGTTAGAKSGSYNIGASTASIAVTKANVVEYITYCEAILTEQNCPEENRFIVIPVWMNNLLENSDLKDASMTGRESTLPNGRIGMLANFEVLVSNNYTAVTDTYQCYHVLFGHKSALTFAAQMDFVETLKNPRDYGDLIRGLMVYGYEVIKPVALGDFYCRRG